MTIEHIGIAVQNLEAVEGLYRMLFPEAEFHRECMPELSVEMLIVRFGGYKIEFLKPLNVDSPIGKFLEKNGNGVHHIAFKVDNIEETMKRVSSEGIRLLTEKPYTGVEGHQVCFMHPKDTYNVLYEFCQIV